MRFDTDRWDLHTPFDIAVNQYAALLNDPRCVNLRVNITGNADFRGTSQHNQILSENRAKAVVDALTSKGIQLYVPLNTKVTYETTGAFAKAVADIIDGKNGNDRFPACRHIPPCQIVGWGC